MMIFWSATISLVRSCSLILHPPRFHLSPFRFSFRLSLLIFLHLSLSSISSQSIFYLRPSISSPSIFYLSLSSISTFFLSQSIFYLILVYLLSSSVYLHPSSISIHLLPPSLFFLSFIPVFLLTPFILLLYLFSISIYLLAQSIFYLEPSMTSFFFPLMMMRNGLTSGGRDEVILYKNSWCQRLQSWKK